MDDDIDSEPLTRRTFLVLKAFEAGATWPLAAEALSSTVLAHPEWDMDETHTWAEWMARGVGG